MKELDTTATLELQLRLHALLTRAVAAGGESLSEALAPCAQAVSAALQADALGIWTFDPTAHELVLMAQTQEERGTQPQPRVALGHAHMVALAASARGAIFHNPRFEEPLFAPPLDGADRHVAVCALVVNTDELVGLIAISSGGRLPAQAESTLAAIADLVAIAVEKQHAAARLREREDGLGTLIATAPDGIIVMDVGGRIVAANPSVEQTFGYQPGEVIGEDVTILMPERFRARHATGVRRYRETGQKRISWHGIELVGLHKDGSEFPIEISFGEYAHNGSIVFTGFIRDISERKRSELRERRRRRLFQTGAVYVGSSFVVLQAADLLVEALAAPEWLLRALVLLAFAGLPLALAGAWGLALGLGGSAPARRGAAAPGRPRLRAALGAAAVLVLLVALGSAARPRGPEVPSAGVIAVLPFDPMGDAEVEPLAAGLTEDLATALAAVDGVRVVSRTSVLALAGPGRTAARIARELHADYVLEGSVRRAGESVRITVRLARAGRDRHVWARTYDRPLADPLAVQLDVAHSSAAALRSWLAGP